MTFTAEQVRRVLQGMAQMHTDTTVDGIAVSALLGAFASRLTEVALHADAFKMVAQALDAAQLDFSRGLEEGRREILREIAALRPPVDWSDTVPRCGWCDLVRGHLPTCLWLRAQQATQETT